ncbi:MAG: glycosyltransferase involved in cell wall biosynthesis [Colwellia sp.]|jgi:glycosyltransferase involved in cell wall biosynthesis
MEKITYMNILYHHRTRGKGAEGVHILGIVTALRKLGHVVNILSFPGSDPEKDNEAKGHDKVAKSSSSPFTYLAKITKYLPEFFFELFELAYNLIILFRLPKTLNQENTKLIYERYSLFMFLGIRIAKKRNIPFILEINDSVLVERVRPIFLSSLAKYIEKWCFTNATGLVFISTYFQELSQKNYGDIAPSIVCPNAADPEYFDPSKYEKENIKSTLGLTNKTVCGYVGAFVKWHGIVWFIEDIAPQLKSHPHLALLLVGDGVCYPNIAALVEKYDLQEQIILTGKVEHKDVPKYISAMDFGILPDSNLYGSSMKHFEFMAMACGMVVPAFEPMKEVVTDKENSWLFDIGNKKQCVDAVLSLSQDVGHLTTVGNNARNYIINERQWLHNAENILGLAFNNENN